MNDDQASPGLGGKASRWKDTAKEKVAPAHEKAAGAWEKTRQVATDAKEAVSGFVDEAKRQDLAGKSKEAAQKAGETAREVGTTAKSEVEQTRESAHRDPQA